MVSEDGVSPISLIFYAHRAQNIQKTVMSWEDRHSRQEVQKSLTSRQPASARVMIVWKTQFKLLFKIYTALLGVHRTEPATHHPQEAYTWMSLPYTQKGQFQWEPVQLPKCFRTVGRNNFKEYTKFMQVVRASDWGSTPVPGRIGSTGGCLWVAPMQSQAPSGRLYKAP